MTMAAVAAGNGMMSHGPGSHSLSSSFFATTVSRHGHPTMVGSPPVTGIHSSGGNSVLGGFSRTPSTSLGSQRGLSVSHMSASGIMPSRSNMPTVVVHQRWGRVLCLMPEVLAHSAFSRNRHASFLQNDSSPIGSVRPTAGNYFIMRLSYYLSPFASLLLLTKASHRRAWFPAMLDWIAEIVDRRVFKNPSAFFDTPLGIWGVPVQETQLPAYRYFGNRQTRLVNWC